MKGKIIILFFLGVGITGCYYDNEEALYPNTVVLPDVVTYAEHIQPILNQNCAIKDCHISGTGLPVVDSYAGAKQLGESGSLKIRVVDQMNMPPVGPLPRNERLMIEKWINTGYQP